MSTLQSQRDRFAGRQLSRAQRQRLLIQIDRACSGRAVTILARRGDEPRKPSASEVKVLPSTNAPSTNAPILVEPAHRTLCVRKADGYYFPISFSTPQTSFIRDAAICKATCPEQEVELFTHPVSDENGPQNMVSLSGEAYTDLPNAFAYREMKFSERAVCGAPDLAKLRDLGYLQKGDTITGAEPETAEKPLEMQIASYPVIRPRPDRADESAPTMNEPQAPAAEVEFTPPTEESVAAQADRDVRVVLPELLPDPATAIDLEAPAPTGDP